MTAANLRFFSRYSYIWRFSPEVEKSYVQFIYLGNFIAFRLANAMVIIGMAMFVVVDFFRDVNYPVVLATRLTSLMISVVFLLLVKKDYRHPNRVEYMIALSILHIFVFATVTVSVAEMPPYFLTNILITLMVLTPIVSGLRLPQSVPLTLFFFLGFIALTSFVLTDPFYRSQYPNLFTILVYTNLAALVVEARRRNSFLQFRDLRMQKETIDQLNQQKGKIISLLSHDVSAPLNSLSGLMQLRERNQISDEELSSFFPEIRKRLDHATTLMQSLARWSKSQMDGFVIDRKAVQWSVLISEVVRLFDQPIKDKNLRIQVYSQADFHSQVDRDIMEIVLRNLISNAVKFSPANGVIEMSVASVGKEIIAFRIANEGEPIDVRRKDQLFTFQINSAPGTRGEKGTGLGLAMSAYFISLHNGRIYLDESSPGIIRFVVELPVS